MKNFINYLSKKSLSLENGSGMTREQFGITSTKSRNSLDSIVSRFCLASLICLCMLTVGVGNAWGTPSVIYTLTPVAGSDNSYAGDEDIDCEDEDNDVTITWNVTGNATMIPWRIGGKGGSKSSSTATLVRDIYCTSALSTDDVSKVILSHGTSTITGSGWSINSVTLIVSTSSDGGGTVISSIERAFKASDTIIINRPAGKDWSSRYFTIRYNISAKGSSNKYLEFSGAEFYAEVTPSCTSITPSLSYASVGGTTLAVGSSSSGSPTVSGNTGSGAVTYSVTAASPAGCATVNSSTGVVTAVAAGTATITASIAANGGYCSGSATANFTITVPAYTVQFSTGTGNPTVSSRTEASGGAGITLPAGPTPTCSGDGWSFAGWKETSAVTSETTVAPTLLSAGSTFHPSGNVTLYAVYQKEDLSTDYEKITSSAALTSGSNYVVARGTAWGLDANKYTMSSNDGYFGVTAISVSENVISNPNADLIWQISGDNTDGYSLYNSNRNLYIGYSTTYHDLYADGTRHRDYTITFTSSNFYIKSKSESSYYFSTWSYSLQGGGSAYFFEIDNSSAYVVLYKQKGTNTYFSNPTCCTPLGTINGSISFTPSATGGTLDWSSEEMTHTDGVYVKRSYTGITGSDPYYDWVHISSGTTSVTFSDLACGGGTTYTWYWKRKGATDYCDDSTPQSNTFTTTTCACSYYSFHYQHGSDWNTDNICFNPVSGGSNDYLTDELSLPYAEWYNVCWQGSGQSYTATKGFSGTTDNIPMKFYHKQDKSFGVNPQAGNIGGGLGKFHVVHNSGNTNKDVTFIPTGYTLNFGTGDWTHDSTLVFTGKTNDWDETEWYTPMTTLTNDAIGRKIFVGLKTSSGYVWCSPYSEKVNLSGLRTKSGSGENWVSGGLTTAYANKTGKFRIYANSGDNNWYVTFVPHYQLKYNANGGSGTMSPLPATPVSCEETSENRTVTVATSSFTAPAHKTFSKWHTAADGTSGIDVATGSRELTGDITLYAIWTYLPQYTVTLNAGANGSLSVDKASSYSDELGTVTITITPSSGYQLSSISAVDGSSNPVSLTGTGNSRTFTMPASNVTVTATFVVRTDYVLVTNVSELNDGDLITLCTVEGNTAEGYILDEQNSNNRARKSITTRADGKIAEAAVAYPIVLESVVGGWKLKDQTNSNNYLYATYNQNYLKNAADPSNSVWTIAVNTTTHVATITTEAYNNNDQHDTRYIQYNGSNSIFSAYKNSQADCYIYKKELGCEKLAAPGGLSVTSKGTTTCTLNWNSVANASGYEVSLDNGETWIPNSTNTTYNVTAGAGWTAGSEHTWKVRATGDGDTYCAKGNAASNTVTMLHVYTVTYDDNGKTGGSVPATANVTEGNTYTIVGNTGSLVKDGYTWAGWHNSTTYNATPYYGTGSSDPISVTANITVYANWAPKRDTYIDGVHSNADQYGDGANYAVPSCSDESQATSGACDVTHYKFIGWALEDADLTDPANIFKGGTKTATGATYYAVWGEEL